MTTVVFTAEPLKAFAFDEPGAGIVEAWLNQVYDGEIDGVVSTINFAEFRSVAIRETTPEQADAHIEDLTELGLRVYGLDTIWRQASKLKASYNPSLAVAYAVAAAPKLDTETSHDVTLLVGAADEYDVFEEEAEFSHLIERFRTEAK